MRTRYSINESGELEARDGTVLGRIVGITIESKSVGTIGEAFSSKENPHGGVGEIEPPTLLPTPVVEVWQTYVEIIKPRRTELDAGSRQTITQALKVRNVTECKRAIVGLSLSDWHMGRDPQTHGKSYKQLSHVLKGKRGGRTTAEQIDFFIDIADKAGVGSEGVPVVDHLKLSRAKAAVITAWEFPADERAAAAGDAARRWLGDHGIAVEMSGTGLELGRPTFRRTA